MIVGDRIGHILQQHRLTGLGLSYDQTTLPLADRGEEVDYARRRPVIDVGRSGYLELEFLCREDREQVVEGNPVANLLRLTSIQSDEFLHGEELILTLRCGDDRLDHIAGLETIVLDLALCHVDIVRRGEVVVVCGADESVAVRKYLQHSRGSERISKVVRTGD